MGVMGLGACVWLIGMGHSLVRDMCGFLFAYGGRDDCMCMCECECCLEASCESHLISISTRFIDTRRSFRTKERTRSTTSLIIAMLYTNKLNVYIFY
jgi:hypothetical protein